MRFDTYGMISPVYMGLLFALLFLSTVAAAEKVFEATNTPVQYSHDITLPWIQNTTLANVPSGTSISAVETAIASKHADPMEEHCTNNSYPESTTTYAPQYHYPPDLSSWAKGKDYRQSSKSSTKIVTLTVTSMVTVQNTTTLTVTGTRARTSAAQEPSPPFASYTRSPGGYTDPYSSPTFKLLASACPVYNFCTEEAWVESSTFNITYICFPTVSKSTVISPMITITEHVHKSAHKEPTKEQRLSSAVTVVVKSTEYLLTSSRTSAAVSSPLLKVIAPTYSASYAGRFVNSTTEATDGTPGHTLSLLPGNATQPASTVESEGPAFEETVTSITVITITPPRSTPCAPGSDDSAACTTFGGEDDFFAGASTILIGNGESAMLELRTCTLTLTFLATMIVLLL